MIGTEQERAALMAAIRKWGTLMNKVGYLCGQDKPSGCESSLCDQAYDAIDDAIRAMLAPDDAVLRGEAWSQVRGLLSRFEDGSTKSMAIMDGVASKAVDLVSAVLRGEATRDE